MSGFDGLSNLMSGMDEQTAKKLLNSIDEEEMQQAIEWVINESVIPHLDDVRQTARQRDATEDAREFYESLPSDEREEMFYQTLDELVAVLVECRVKPKQGFRELKTMLRDPYTTEALLLIFENEDHIDAEYTDQLKDFAAIHLRWVGAMVVPEMYDEHEVNEVLDTFDIDEQPGDADVGR